MTIPHCLPYLFIYQYMHYITPMYTFVPHAHTHAHTHTHTHTHTCIHTQTHTHTHTHTHAYTHAHTHTHTRAHAHTHKMYVFLEDVENPPDEFAVVSTAKENKEYYLIPQQAWKKLVLWYSLSDSTKYYGW